MSLTPTSESFTPDNLFYSDYPVTTDSITVLTGQGVLSRGSVLGKVTASGKYKLTDSESTDGSEDPKYILLEEVDTSSADVESVGAKSGNFNSNSLVFGGSDTIATHVDAMRDVGLYVNAADIPS